MSNSIFADRPAPAPHGRDVLTAIYLDWVNNYASTARYAECNGLSEGQAISLLAVARVVFNSDHPET